MAKALTAESATPYLQGHGVRIGAWNGLEPLQSRCKTVQSSFCTGKSVYELNSLSKQVAEWLAKGNWKILQIDNSSVFQEDEWSLLCALLLGPTKQVDFLAYQTFLFEFGCGEKEDFQTEVVLTHIIYLMLVYEAHCYVISSGGNRGEMLAIQDGFIYFYGDDDRLSCAQNLLDKFASSGRNSAP